MITTTAALDIFPCPKLRLLLILCSMKRAAFEWQPLLHISRRNFEQQCIDSICRFPLAGFIVMIVNDLTPLGVNSFCQWQVISTYS